MSTQIQTRGMALIEVLLSVLILSVGLIVIYRPLLTSFDTLNYIDTRSEAADLAGRQIWDVQEASYRTGVFPKIEPKGVLLGKERTYDYEMSASPVMDKDRLYQLDLALKWREGGKAKSMDRAVYIWVPYKEKLESEG